MTKHKLVKDCYEGKLFVKKADGGLSRLPLYLKEKEDNLIDALQKIHDSVSEDFPPVEVHKDNLAKLINQLGGTIGNSKIATYDFGSGHIYNADEFHKGAIPVSIEFRPFNSSNLVSGDKVDLFVHTRDGKFVKGVQLIIK